MPFFMMLYSPQPKRGGRARRTPHTFSSKLFVEYFISLTLFEAQHQPNSSKTFHFSGCKSETYPRPCDKEGDKGPTAQ